MIEMETINKMEKEARQMEADLTAQYLRQMETRQFSASLTTRFRKEALANFCESLEAMRIAFRGQP